ncbi:MAG TPA: hypothetical protein VGM87_13780 [Roseomonas sp.]
MAKGQKRNSREAKKPKQTKQPKAAAASSFLTPRATTVPPAKKS